jgi:hypothetical protein
MALLSGAQQIFGINTSSITLSQRPTARGRVSQAGSFPACVWAAVTFAVSLTARSPSSRLKPVQSGRCPATATHHWRLGPHWPAKMAPSPAAANNWAGGVEHPVGNHHASQREGVQIFAALRRARFRRNGPPHDSIHAEDGMGGVEHWLHQPEFRGEMKTAALAWLALCPDPSTHRFRETGADRQP